MLAKIRRSMPRAARYLLTLVGDLGVLTLVIVIAGMVLQQGSQVFDPERHQSLALFLLIPAALIAVAWVSYRMWRQLTIAVWFRSGTQLFRQQRYDEALAAYERVLAIQPSHALARWNKALCLSGLRRYEDALAVEEQILTTNPYSSLGWYNKGLSLARLGRFQEAIDAYAQAIAISPRYSMAWTNKGVDLARLGRYDEALADFNRALELDPANALAWNNKADILCERLKRYEEAIAVCDAARQQRIETAGLWELRANALHALGRNNEASAAYWRVLKFPANDFLSWAAHGAAHAGIGQFIQALSAYEKALALRPDNPRVWREKAAVLRAVGRDDEAQEADAQAHALGWEE